jgi:predicted MPP superfamily phosphohydrolase
MTRRFFLRWVSRIAATGAALAAYGLVIEPGFRLKTTAYAFTPPRWTPGLKLRIVMLADPHCIEPHMPLSRWKNIIAAANALQPDVHLLMGDYVASHRFSTGRVPYEEVADAALALKAPLGTFAIMGNHDWWEDVEAGHKGTTARPHAQHVFWLSGTNSLVALRRPDNQFESRADLSAALAQVSDDAPIIHLAHEPDLFVDIPERVSLTLSGHTHGGQVRLFGYSPVTPSAFGNRFAYGHVIENGRHLVVSGGLGCSIMPVRFGVPPEIVVLDLG